MTEIRPHLRGFRLSAALMLAAVAALAIDMSAARFFRPWNASDPLALFEFFGHGVGVIVLVVALHQLDRGRRWAIPRVLACAFAAGGVADLLKIVVFRFRPYAEHALDGTVWSTFGQWFPVLGIGNPGQSFPSAHTATAFGFAAALTWLYPQGRFLFPVLAVLVGCQRIVSGAHFPSDVLIGAAAGCVTAQFFLKVGPLPARFDHWEDGWKST